MARMGIAAYWRRRFAPSVLLGACFVLGAVSVRPVAARSALFEALAAEEVVHIGAHLLLYGGLTLVLRRAGASARGAACFSMGVAACQELAQLWTLPVGRPFGLPEVFDLTVDGAAVLVALLLHRAADGRPAAEPRPR